MDYAFFGPDPAELRVVYEMAPRLTPVGNERVKSAAFDTVCDVGDGEADYFVAAAYCEGLGLLLLGGFVV